MTLTLATLCVLSVISIAWNLICGWHARRDVRAIHTTIQLIAENGDGDQFAVVQLHSVHPWDEPVRLSWQNPAAVPVHLIGWVLAWDWPAVGMSGEDTERVDVYVAPREAIEMHATVGLPHQEDEQ